MSDDTNDPQVLLNQAVEYHQQKRLHEAENIYLLLLEHLPHVPEINDLYAMLLTQTGRGEEAIPHLKIVTEANPDIKNLMRFAMICLKHNQPDLAVEKLDQLLKTTPDHLEANILKARAQQVKGEDTDALHAFYKLHVEHPDSHVVFHHLGLSLYNYRAEGYSTDDEKILSYLAQHPDILALKYIHNLIGFMCHHPLWLRYEKNIDQGLDKLLPELRPFLLNPITCVLLDDCLLINARFEEFLCRLRAHYLCQITSANIQDIVNADDADILCHMANQCFFNEYVYYFDEKESAQLPILINLLINSHELSPTQLKTFTGLLACYQPLYKSSLPEDTVAAIKDLDDDLLNKLIIEQMNEPAREEALAEKLDTIGEITAGVSTDVQALYEESPYPRWKNYSDIKPRSFQDYLKTELPSYKPENTSFPLQPDILVAGGGTGQHPLMTARIVENSRLLTIDLSRQSLGYAMRKAEEIGVDNISFKQADILQLEKLDQQFDIIESVGVIHHMEDPISGWGKLYDRLRPGGYLKLGLYSHAAREHLNYARQKINDLNFDDDLNSIRSFRKKVLELPEGDKLKEVEKSYDFYALSSCRDLLFHVQEHLFDVPTLKKAINKFEMEFLGFSFPSGGQLSAFRKMFPEPGAERNLDNWDQFERKAPNCFGAMYVFWMRKPE